MPTECSICSTADKNVTKSYFVSIHENIEFSSKNYTYQEIRLWVVGELLRNNGIVSLNYLARKFLGLEGLVIKRRLCKELKKAIHNVSMKIEYALKPLIKEGFIKRIKLNGLIHYELLEKEKWENLAKTLGVDLKYILSGPQTTHYTLLKDRNSSSSSYEEKGVFDYRNEVKGRIHPYRFELLFLGNYFVLNVDGKKFIVNGFLEYLDDVDGRVIVLVAKGDFVYPKYIVRKYSTRFNDENRIKLMLFKFSYVFDYLLRKYKYGVFLTITLPPVIPLGLYGFILKYMIDQLRAWIVKKHKVKVKILRVNEFHNDGRLHVHLVIFGVKRICDKHELTVRLDVWFVNALLRLYKRYSIDYVNGLIENYLDYCKRNPKYEGPINHVTPIKVKEVDGKLVYLWRPPPDALRFIEKGDRKVDGGGISPKGYLSKYLGKALRTIEKLKKGEVINDVDLFRLSCYWLFNTRFFTYDYRLNKEIFGSKVKPPSCYSFIGSFHIDDIPELIYEEVEEEIKELVGEFTGPPP